MRIRNGQQRILRGPSLIENCPYLFSKNSPGAREGYRRRLKRSLFLSVFLPRSCEPFVLLVAAGRQGWMRYCGLISNRKDRVVPFRFFPFSWIIDKAERGLTAPSPVGKSGIE